MSNQTQSYALRLSVVFSPLFLVLANLLFDPAFNPKPYVGIGLQALFSLLAGIALGLIVALVILNMRHWRDILGRGHLKFLVALGMTTATPIVPVYWTPWTLGAVLMMFIPDGRDLIQVGGVFLAILGIWYVIVSLIFKGIRAPKWRALALFVVTLGWYAFLILLVGPDPFSEAK